MSLKQDSDSGERNKKFNFAEKKENTVHSLFEVEHFLRDFKNVCKGIKLYQIIKK